MDVLFSWIQLSDIHAGPDAPKPDPRLMLDQIQRELAEVLHAAGVRPDVVLVTGDIAFSGDAAARSAETEEGEYARARTWLDQVATTAGLSSDKVFTVPGNHDVARSTKLRERSFVQSLRRGDVPVDEALADEDSWTSLEARFANYLGFCGSLNPACAKLDGWSARFSGRDGLEVRLIGLNTALLCNDNEDHGHLRLGRKQLQPLPDRRDGEVTLVLSHHPLDQGWLQKDDEQNARSWIENHANVHVHGHALEASARRFNHGGSSRPHLCIAAGAAHERPARAGSTRYGYNFAAIVRGEGGRLELRVWPRHWSEKQAGFVVDAEAVREPERCAVLDLGIDAPGAPARSTEALPPAPLAPAPPRDAVLDAAEEAYRMTIADRYKRLSIRMRSADPVELPLEEVYVELKVIADIPPGADTFSVDERRLFAELGSASGHERLEKERQLDEQRYRRWRRPDAPRPSAPQSILERAGASGRPLVILGDPGSGKSTLLHVMAMRAASGRLWPSASVRRDWLPILVPLAAYDEYTANHDEHVSLQDFLSLYYETWCQQSDCGRIFLRALEEGRALVLLDGLDEVLTPTRRAFVAKQVEALLQRWAPLENRFVITSRPIGYREVRLTGDIEEVTIVDFSMKEIELFLEQWCAALERWADRGLGEDAARARAAPERKALLEEIGRAPHLQALASNPLKLSMLAVLHRQRSGRLPTRRVELYREFTTMLLELRPEQRSPGARKDPVDRFEAGDARVHVANLALWLQEHRPSGTASRDDLLRALRKSFLSIEASDPASPKPKEVVTAEKNAEKLLDELRLIEGLIAARAVDAFGFLHLTYQEFFAAWALARKTPEERWAWLRPRLHQPRFRETILLCAGCLGVLNDDTPQVDDLIRRVLAAGSEHEALLHRDVLLGVAIVAEDVRTSRRVLDRLYDEIEALTRAPLSAVREQSVAGLVTLVKFGCEASIGSLTNLMVKATEELSSSRYVTSGGVYGAVGGILHLQKCKPILDFVLHQLEEAREESQYWGVVAAALWSIGGLIRQDTQVRSRVTQVFFDEHRDLRTVLSAEHVLAPLLGECTDVLDAFIGACQSEKIALRQRAIPPLIRHMWNHERVRPLLDRWWEDVSIRNVRSSLISVAGRLAKDDPRWFDRVVHILSMADPNEKQAAVSALGQIIADFPEAERILTDSMSSEDPALAQAALNALAPLLRVRDELRQTLLSRLHLPEHALRLHAVGLLGRIVAFHPEVREPIILRLNDYDEQVRATALRVLSPVVDEEPTLRKEFLRRLDNTRTCRKSNQIATVAPLIVTDPSLRAPVEEYLYDADPFARAAAIDALAPLLEPKSDLVRRILAHVMDHEAAVSHAAIRSLGPLARIDEAVRDTLIGIVCNAKDDVAAIAVAVDALAPSAEESMGRRALLRLFDQGSSFVRAKVSKVLAHLSAKDSEIQGRFQRLIVGLKDQNADDRDKSLEVLRPAINQDPVLETLLRQVRTSLEPSLGLINVMASFPEKFVPSHEEWIAVLARKADVPVIIRQHAISALSRYAGIGVDESARRALLDVAQHGDVILRSQSIHVLADHFIQNKEVQQFLVEMASAHGRNDSLPYDATEHLSVYVALIPAIEQLLRRLLNDNLGAATYGEHLGIKTGLGYGRQLWAAVGLSALVDRDRELCLRLIPWLGARTYFAAGNVQQARKTIAQRLARLVPEDEALRLQLMNMLESPAWQDRQGAAWTLIAAPGDKSPELLAKLRALLHDDRAEESWTERLQVAAMFLNHKDAALSRRALEVVKQALTCGREPWAQTMRSEVRTRAAQILGTLEPMYADRALVDQVVRAISEETSEDVQTALYHALLHLAALEEPTPS